MLEFFPKYSSFESWFFWKELQFVEDSLNNTPSRASLWGLLAYLPQKWRILDEPLRQKHKCKVIVQNISWWIIKNMRLLSLLICLVWAWKILMFFGPWGSTWLALFWKCQKGLLNVGIFCIKFFYSNLFFYWVMLG